MTQYRYRCPTCASHLEIDHPMAQTDVPVLCALSGTCLPDQPQMQRVPLGGTAFAVTGTRHRDTPLRREFVVANRDGSESVYRTREQAYRQERERTGNARIAAYNMKHLEKSGYLAHTRHGQQAAALDDAPGGPIAKSVLTGAL